MTSLAALEAELRACALGYPEAHEDFPWGERVIKVRGKIFCFLWTNAASLGFTAKLPASHEFALLLEGCEPTGYGLGRSGWVTCHLRDGAAADVDMLKGWIDESYRAIAPKTLVRSLAGPAQ
jgi:predicted DNA-binding protein (MmcQ/YjbR family)